MRNPHVLHDTEDKRHWTKFGEKLEDYFLREIAPHLEFDIKLNPEKSTNPYVPDLLVNGNLADLKTQNTPFFTARRYSKDPGRTVTFNHKDFDRYNRLYPGLPVYFYVRWDQLVYESKRQGKTYKIEVPFLHGVWATDVYHIKKLIAALQAPLHEYQNRVNDTKGNAKNSYLLSLDDLQLVKLFA